MKMLEELSKILDVTDLHLDFKRVKNINGYDIEHSVFASDEKQMKVEVWRNVGNSINFCKVVIEINGKEFNETISSQSFNPNLFSTYLKTIKDLSDDQLFFVFNYLEGLVSEIDSLFRLYEQQKNKNELLDLKIIGLLNEYLNFKGLIDMNEDHLKVQLFKLLSPSIDRPLNYFKIYLNMNQQSKIVGFYDSIFSMIKV